MLLPQSSTQSGGATYRRVVNRNILCTVCIVVTYSITTLVVVLSLLGSSFKVHSLPQTINNGEILNLLPKNVSPTTPNSSLDEIQDKHTTGFSFHWPSRLGIV